MSGEENLRRLNVGFATHDEFAGEWQKNISKGGVFLNVDPPPDQRERVVVVIEIADIGSGLELHGEVVYVTPQGVGIQLDPLPLETTEAVEAILAGEAPPAKEEEQKTDEANLSLYQRIQQMSRHEKAAMARKGNMDARNILVRDRDPLIVTAVLQNPRISMAEIIQISKSQGLSLEMIKHITKQPDWMSNEDVRLNIVLNPKTPLPTALNLLKRLSDRNVRMIAKRPLKQQIKSAAVKLVIERHGGR